MPQLLSLPVISIAGDVEACDVQDRQLLPAQLQCCCVCRVQSQPQAAEVHQLLHLLAALAQLQLNVRWQLAYKLVQPNNRLQAWRMTGR